jgi:hypothetical protein
LRIYGITAFPRQVSVVKGLTPGSFIKDNASGAASVGKLNMVMGQNRSKPGHI